MLRNAAPLVEPSLSGTRSRTASGIALMAGPFFGGRETHGLGTCRRGNKTGAEGATAWRASHEAEGHDPRNTADDRDGAGQTNWWWRWETRRRQAAPWLRRGHSALDERSRSICSRRVRCRWAWRRCRWPAGAESRPVGEETVDMVIPSHGQGPTAGLTSPYRCWAASPPAPARPVDGPSAWRT